MESKEKSDLNQSSSSPSGLTFSASVSGSAGSSGASRGVGSGLST
jgi:hypothetical protein